MSSSRIKGVYTKSLGSSLGATRWLDPASGIAYKEAEGGNPELEGFYRTQGREWITSGGYYEFTPDAPTSIGPDQAFKADDGKPNWFLLMSQQGCAKALAGVVRVLSFAVRSKDKGGKGYTEHSWRQVPNAKERYEAALYRHLNKVQLGEALDDESGESHWYHIATNALFLAELHNAEGKQ